MPSKQHNQHKGTPQSSHLTQHTRYSPAGRSYLPVKSQQCYTVLVADAEDTAAKTMCVLTLFTSVSPQHHWVLCGDQCPHLGEDVGALLQQRHGGLSQTGGQLDPQQLLLLGEVVLQGVSQGYGGAPVGQRVCRKEASAQQLPRRDGICCEEKGTKAKQSG